MWFNISVIEMICFLVIFSPMHLLYNNIMRIIIYYCNKIIPIVYQGQYVHQHQRPLRNGDRGLGLCYSNIRDILQRNFQLFLPLWCTSVFITIYSSPTSTMACENTPPMDIQRVILHSSLLTKINYIYKSTL